MSHTPGPWKFVNAWGPLPFDGRHRFLKCVGPDYQTVLCTNDRSFDIQARQEDMHLIAEAPELLKVARAAWHLCEALLVDAGLPELSVGRDLIEEIRDAAAREIAKAEE